MRSGMKLNNEDTEALLIFTLATIIILGTTLMIDFLGR